MFKIRKESVMTEGRLDPVVGEGKEIKNIVIGPHGDGVVVHYVDEQTGRAGGAQRFNNLGEFASRMITGDMIYLADDHLVSPDTIKQLRGVLWRTVNPNKQDWWGKGLN